MYDIFNKYNGMQIPMIPPNNPYRNYLTKVMVSRDKAMEVHRRRSTYAPNDHILVRLLKGMLPFESEDVISYVKRNAPTLKRRAKVLGLTTETTLGVAQKDPFMRNETAYILVLENEDKPFNAILAANTLKGNISPITVHFTTGSDLSMNIPGEYKNGLSVISFYSIDIPVLLASYKKYHDDTEDTPTPAKFVRNHLFINMIPQYLDHALANTAFDLYDNLAVESDNPSMVNIFATDAGIYKKLVKKHYKPAKIRTGAIELINNVITTKKYTLHMYKYPDVQMNRGGLMLHYAFTALTISRVLTQGSKKLEKFERANISKYKIMVKMIKQSKMENYMDEDVVNHIAMAHRTISEETGIKIV